MSYTETIRRLEELYRELMGSEIATQQEVKAKAEIISLVPQLKALVLAEETPEAKELEQRLEKLYELVSKWNPLTAWFRDEETLVQLYIEMLSDMRLFLIRQQAPSTQSGALVSESIGSIRQTINHLASVVEEIRVSVKTLMEIVSPTPEVHGRIASLSSRAMELEQRIADFDSSHTTKTEADVSKIERWKKDLQKLSKQINTLRKLARQQD